MKVRPEAREPSAADNPGSVDVLVLGGGTSGAAFAGTVARLSGASVLVLEAGPDYGPLSARRWPADLLDATRLPLTHDWGYTNGDHLPGRVISFPRGRVIGGSSSHNRGQITIGHRLDYDGWAAAGNDGWSTDELMPYVASAKERLRVNQAAEEDLTPFSHESLRAMVAVGIPYVPNLNDLDGGIGAAPSPVNVVGRLRWNAAFAYLDPVRGKQVRVIGNALVDRLLVHGSRVAGAVAIIDGRRVTIRADHVAVCAGVYGSPAILLRSGIGDPTALARLGIRPTHALPGVGRNLQDHPAIRMGYAGTARLLRRSRAFAHRGSHPEQQVIAKTRSSQCQTGFDIHLYTHGGIHPEPPHYWAWECTAAVLTPRSRGSVRLWSAEPDASPVIDHALLTDPDGRDLALLAEAVQHAHAVTEQPKLARLLGAETTPAAGAHRGSNADRELRRAVVSAHHPVGTCRMGPATDPDAVVGPAAQIHGLAAGYVIDASIMPTIPRADTSLPAAVVGERVAAIVAARLCGQAP